MGAVDVAVREEQIPVAGVGRDRAIHRLEAPRLHLVYRLAAWGWRGERVFPVLGIVGIVDQVVVHHPVPSPILNFSELQIFDYRNAANPGRDYFGRLMRTNQRTGDDQLRFKDARDWNRRFDLRASILVEFDWIAAHDPPFAIPFRFAMAHKKRDPSHASRGLQFFRDVKRSKRHTGCPLRTKYARLKKSAAAAYQLRPPPSNQIFVPRLIHSDNPQR